MKVIVSYPGVMPAATEVARAFFEAGMLERYASTFAHRPGSWLSNALHVTLWSALRTRASGELKRRQVEGVPPELITNFPFRELLRIACSRLQLPIHITDQVWEWTILNFDRKVATLLRPGVSAVYGYEHACRYSFERAEELGIARIYDMASLHCSFLEKLFARERLAFPHLFLSDWRAIHAKDERRNNHKAREYVAADLIIANSRFTARTLVESGYDGAKVRVVPYGAPDVAEAKPEAKRAIRPFFLFAGTASVRKGTHYLLEAWKLLGAPKGAELILAGKWELPTWVRTELPESVRVIDHLPRQELNQLYGNATALILPSLADGFGLVVTEAMSLGLPPIVTTDVGASDLISHGRNGWIVPPADPIRLAEVMEWCLSHLMEVREIGERARITASENSWANYRHRLVETVTGAINGELGAVHHARR